MGGSNSAPKPSGFVYISERKLLALARLRGISTAWYERHISLEGKGRLSLPLPPGIGVSAQAAANVQRVQPDQYEQAIERLLDRVVHKLEREGLTDLDAETGMIIDGSWFYFQRRLRFGIASAEGDPDIRALVLIDRPAVDDYSARPGLLMFGSPEHLCPPYRSEKLNKSPGNRSGSRTGTLFCWLQSARELLETNPQADLNVLRDGLSLEDDDAPHTMYGLLVQNDWMGNPGLPEFLDHRPCEGLAEVSFIAAGDHRTTVMATPLYVRVRQLPKPHQEVEGGHRSLGGWLSRVIRRQLAIRPSSM